eukprot:CAMPEP_0201503924 /NCGR_PEP_ID=MMETSP0151_2-20130828/84927_1 /ASSEMBLY_ACC=CAM_ASM_000257 /TAXON_ID=200890 /ORGANISM="Paramoeba atlantica, Strain 621/1 / CCAP 1560/9" /LENGTH=412 /DNA_ID=CAMNT_0047897623 /DNA_START=192 /DNA_END=1431 /DNA_ORIENTATION=+
MLFGGGIKGGGKLKKSVMVHSASLDRALKQMMHKAKVASVEKLLPDQLPQIPRYVRFNTLLISVQDAIEAFVQEGYLVGNPTEENPVGKTFYADDVVDDLFVFPETNDFHNHPMLQEGKIVLQDKASCFPAFILSQCLRDYLEITKSPFPSSCHIIDACAAPGNKTSHMSAQMGNKGTIFAFDRDKTRLKRLQENVSHFGCQNVLAKRQNFLEVDHLSKEFEQVRGIIVDPSCSGSGIVSRGDQFIKQLSKGKKGKEETQEEEVNRLENLASFQLKILKKALSFPSVKYVVYSTCSIHDIENENVVKNVLDSDEFRSQYRLKNVLPDFQGRGKPLFPDSTFCIRTDPSVHNALGFFVACFEKIEEDDIGQGDKPNQMVIEPESFCESVPDSQGQSKKKKKKKKKKKNPEEQS